MKDVSWEDSNGRMFLSKIEDDEPDRNANQGIFIGPPEIVDELGLPDEVATRLHNQLFHRKMWTLKDIQRRPQELLAALQSALNVNVQSIMTAYAEYEKTF